MSVVGLTVWVDGGAVLRSTPQVGTLADVERFWRESVPRDGIVRILQHRSEQNIGGGFRLRDYIAGSNWYFYAPTAERVVHNDDPPALNRERYGNAIALSRGKWTTDRAMEASLLEAHEDRLAP